jgi:hypothetical protein
MPPLTRRRFLTTTAVAGAALAMERAQAQAQTSPWRIATFRAEVTPPVGHPLLAGWIAPVETVADPLEVNGAVILGAGAPIVLCAVDWAGLLNDAHLAWRRGLAAAVGTTEERVAVQCVHQHDAPFVCPRAHEIVSAAGLAVYDPGFFDAALRRVAEAARASLAGARPLTHVARGEARVERIASNRRVLFDAEGRIVRMRGSACRDEELLALPEGLIDPLLRTVALYSGADPVLACHTYATHPMSYYGKGEVSADFVGRARRRLQARTPGCRQVYFTGAAGNIAAGKYNPGTPESREALAERLATAMDVSVATLRPRPLKRISWSVQPVTALADPRFEPAALRATVADTGETKAARTIAAMRLAWRERTDSGIPLLLTALHLDDLSFLQLPGEAFLEYQMRASALAPGRWVATAAYGDGGPWYIPVRAAYPQGGYEVSVAFPPPEFDDGLTAAIRAVLDNRV